MLLRLSARAPSVCAVGGAGHPRRCIGASKHHGDDSVGIEGDYSCVGVHACPYAEQLVGEALVDEVDFCEVEIDMTKLFESGCDASCFTTAQKLAVEADQGNAGAAVVETPGFGGGEVVEDVGEVARLLGGDGEADTSSDGEFGHAGCFIVDCVVDNQGQAVCFKFECVHGFGGEEDPLAAVTTWRCGAFAFQDFKDCV